jgi:hypothetical protein
VNAEAHAGCQEHSGKGSPKVIRHLPYAVTYAGGQTKNVSSLSLSLVMNHVRIGEISAEMAVLLEQQSRVLNNPLVEVSAEELDAYAKRNQRLRDLSKELTEI